MPVATRAGAEIHYETAGNGPPLVLLEGLGYGNWMWRNQVGTFSRNHRLVLIDNRGIAPSTPLRGPYSMDEFARDALATLDAEGIDRASFLGVSMGGLIAQSIAALAPDRVERLVLVSTSAGGPEALPMPPSTWAELTRLIPGENGADRVRRTMAIAFTPEFVRERGTEFEELIRVRLGYPMDPTQLLYQAQSALTFDATSPDRNIERSSLVIVGTEDRVLPWTNSLLLFRILRSPSLLLFRRQNHLIFLERPDEFNGAVEEFLTGPTRPYPPIREVDP
jgi:pimeloyl-ACP methyl ester carboxylesterase